MDTRRSLVPWKGGAAALGALALVVAACAEPTGLNPEGMNLENNTPPPEPSGYVDLCKVGPAGTIASFTVSASDGILPLGGNVDVLAGTCERVWEDFQPAYRPDPPVYVTITEVNLPAGIQFDGIDAVTDGYATVDGMTVTFTVNAFHSGTATYNNSEIPPPPGPCVGLTPGYWKSWDNRYTSEQFESLLAGTIAGSIEEAESILNANDDNSSAIDKLAKFTLANQLTLNLTGTDLPNPDDAGLTELCVDPAGDTELGDALNTALMMLADPGSYSDDEILDVKDILDRIANME